MNIWNDLFEIYRQATDDVVAPQPVAADKTDDSQDPAPQTVYVFAYIDDGKGNITRNIAVEDRITMLEMKNQELEHRYNALIEQLGDEVDELETPNND